MNTSKNRQSLAVSPLKSLNNNMAYSITGRIKAIGPVQAIPLRDGQGTFVKRILTLDITQYDRFTGERGRENTPQIEFAGERNAAKLEGYYVGQLVSVNFAIEGRTYAKDGQSGIINSIQGYGIEPYGRERAYRPTGMQEQPAAPTPSPTVAYPVNPEPVQTPRPQQQPQPTKSAQGQLFPADTTYGARPSQQYSNDLPF